MLTAVSDVLRRRTRNWWLAIGGLIVLSLIVLIRTAWVADDPYITFRTIDNAANGFGLRWNVAERVQSFTHPLWMFLLLVFYLLTSEIYFTVIAVSMVLSIGVVCGVAWTARTIRGAALSVILLLCSKAFIDYSSSGLENPLTHALYLLFLVRFVRYDKTPRQLMQLCLIAAFCCVNRLDSSLLFAPALFVAWLQCSEHRGRALLYAALGFSPLLAWEAFSIVYYGVPFPNTYYAKLHAGVPGARLLPQGFAYFVNSLGLDPTTLTFIFLGTYVGLRTRGSDRWIAAGVLLYLLYVVRIGGDFMSGRFFSTPMVAAVIILQRAIERGAAEAFVRKWFPQLVGVVLICGFWAPYPAFLTGTAYSGAGFDIELIGDERGFYFQDNGLLNVWRTGGFEPDMRADGLRLRAGGEQVKIIFIAGIRGYYAGPDVHLVDRWALVDAFVARLPTYKKFFKVGHFTRNIPPGYEETLRTGRNHIEDEGLRELYEKIKLVTRGDLFAEGRWTAIWELNTGQLEHLVPVEHYAQWWEDTAPEEGAPPSSDDPVEPAQP